MADPKPNHGTPVAADGSAGVRLRFGRPPRAANDNAFSWLKRGMRLAPLLLALALLAWALIRAFGGH